MVANPNHLNNVYVDISVELGRKEITIDQARGIQEQDTIEFDKLASEAFDVLINGRAFAEGEIVVVTDLMAIRITRLINREAP
jgi:flagellar motor switch protein FliN/FliY